MTVIDFHSHILPGVDDGSSSVEESVAMLRMEAEQGIGQMIATPHFYPQHDKLERFLKRRDRAMALLQHEIGLQKDLPEILLGAEVYFFRGMSESDHLARLTIGEKSCILVEMPPPPWTDEMYRELEQIWIRQGIIPVVAHIDRYVRPFRTYGIPKRLANLPVLVQANADFFVNRITAKMAMRMLEAGQIHLLGTDCHNTRSRKPDLQVALQKIQAKFGETAIKRINDYEKRALNG